MSQGKSSSKETMKPLIKTKAWIRNQARYIFHDFPTSLRFYVVYYSFLNRHQVPEKSANFQVRLSLPIEKECKKSYLIVK